MEGLGSGLKVEGVEGLGSGLKVEGVEGLLKRSGAPTVGGAPHPARTPAKRPTCSCEGSRVDGLRVLPNHEVTRLSTFMSWCVCRSGSSPILLPPLIYRRHRKSRENSI